MTKTVLFLGAASFQLPPIRYAREKGYRILTCDNRPKNPGHRIADRSFSVSTVDREAVLAIAEKERPDAILSYASDVSMPTVAWVGKKLGLPAPSEEAVKLLTHKGHFREFLRSQGLQKETRFAVFGASDKEKARAFARGTGFPLIAKPVDSAGSRGVGVAASADEFEHAFKRAASASRVGEVIIENIFEKNGPQICGNGFIQGGKIAFVAFGDGYFYEDRRWLAPWGESFPSDHAPETLETLRDRLEKIMVLAGYPRGLFNVDARVGKDGSIFIVEIGPRSGGNFMDEAILLGQGVDLAGAAVESALSADFTLPPPVQTDGHFYACFMAHSLASGRLEGIDFAENIRPNLVRYVPYLEKGAKMSPFTQGSLAAGNAILRFPDAAEMRRSMTRMPSDCRAELS